MPGGRLAPSGRSAATGSATCRVEGGEQEMENRSSRKATMERARFDAEGVRHVLLDLLQRYSSWRRQRMHADGSAEQ